jgi:hypothetical protein
MAVVAPWLVRTGQRWKLAAGCLVLSGAGVCFVLGIAAFSKCTGPVYAACASDDAGAVFMATGTLAGFVGFVWLALSTRCAACGTRVVWRAMSKEAARSWLVKLASLEACPACGDSGEGQQRGKVAGS